MTATAQAQLESLEAHYAALNRDSAILRMVEAVARAAVRIEQHAGPFWSAPRPYPDLSDLGWTWLKEGRYWIAFSAIADDYAVTGLFFDTGDIPARL